MKDTKRLNDVLDGDCEDDCSLLDESDQCTCNCLLGWNDCHVAVICIFDGQFSSNLPDTDKTVFHHNLKISVVNSEDLRATVNDLPTTEAECDALIADGVCPGCEVMEGKCPDLCADPPELDEAKVTGIKDQGYFADDQRTPKELADYVDDMINTCDDCPDASPDNCDGCLSQKSSDLAGPPDLPDADPDFCEACKIATSGECDGVDPENCGFHPDYQDNEPDPDECLDKADLFKDLKDVHWNVMCEWSLTAAKCQFQFENRFDDELICVHTDGKLDPCHFSMCPRMHSA